MGLSLADDRVKLKAAAADDTDDELVLPNSDFPGVAPCWSKPCLKSGPELITSKPPNGGAAVVLFAKEKNDVCAGACPAADTADGSDDTALEVGMCVVETTASLPCSGLGDNGGVTSSYSGSVFPFGRPSLEALSSLTAADWRADACETGMKVGPEDGLTATKPGLDACMSPNLKPVDAAVAGGITLGLAELKMGAWAGAPETPAVLLVDPKEKAEVTVVAPDEPCPTNLNLNSGCVIGAVKGDGEPASLEVTMASERVGSGFVTTVVTAADEISGGAIVNGVMVRSLWSRRRMAASAAEPLFSESLLLGCTDTSITFVSGNLDDSGGMVRANVAPDGTPLDAAASVRTRGVDVRNDCVAPSESPNGFGVNMASLISTDVVDFAGVEGVKNDPCC